MIVADDLTEEQIKAFRLADNKTAELAEWDFAKLEEELADLSLNMDQFGFITNEEVNIDDFFVEAEEKPEKEPKKCTCPECGYVFEV